MLPVWVLLFGATLWAIGAIYFDLPIAWLRTLFALVYGAAILALFILVKRRGLALVAGAASFLLVLIWWLSIKPSNDPSAERMSGDWRVLVNGKGDELLYERHLIATGGLSFAELKQRSRINERERAADKDPDFSRLIRSGLPCFGPE